MFVKDLKGNHVRCPECQSTDVRYSESHTIKDIWMWFLKQHSLRCRKCRKRFYARTNEAANVVWVKRWWWWKVGVMRWRAYLDENAGKKPQVYISKNSGPAGCGDRDGGVVLAMAMGSACPASPDHANLLR